MSEFVIELILIATIIVPLIASPLEPSRAGSRNRSGLCHKLRRSH
jgi:hypothetical protein